MKNIDKSVVGKVEIVSGIPIYMYSVPIDDYENVGKSLSLGNTFKIVLDEETTLSLKVEKAIQIANDRKNNGKVSDFDALEIRVKKAKAFGLKYKDKKTLKAYIEKVQNIPVFIYSKPVEEYQIVAHLPADFSKRAGRGLLHDKIKNMMKRNLQKVEMKEVGQFDPVIINPDNLSQTFIKFKN